jgi:hypothetical protein
VRAVGLEPTRGQAPTDFKSGLSTIPARPHRALSSNSNIGPMYGRQQSNTKQDFVIVTFFCQKRRILSLVCLPFHHARI